MTSLILCPECQKAVGFPEGTHPSAQVRCPLCEKEFTLGEAIPDDVAELVIVDPGFVAAESEAAADANQSNESLGMAAGGEAASLTGATETEGAPDATDEDSEETMFFEGGVPDGTADIEGKEGDVSFDDFGFGDTADGDGTEVKDKEADEEKEKAEGEEGTEGFDFGFGGEAADDSDFAGTGFSTGEEADGGSVAATMTQPKKRKGIGFKGQLIGIVVFGVIGLALGYGILKLIKPAAAAPIDNMLGNAWSSVSSLWGGGTATDEDGGATANADANAGGPMNTGAFEIGGMLPENQRPKGSLNVPSTVNDVAQPNDNMPKSGDDFPVDDIFASPDSNTDELATPASDDPRPFASLLGQSDGSGVFRPVEGSQIDEAFAKAVTLGNDPSAKLPPVYFAMSDLGNMLAMLQDLSDPETQVRVVDAENLARQVAGPKKQPSLTKFSHQWLQFEKRPPAFKDKRGVFLVGKAQRIVPLGEVFATELEVGTDNKSRIVVVTPKRPDLHVHDMVAVLGSVVRDAVIQLPGYDPSDALKEFSADPSTIVLSNASVKLPKN